MRLVVLDPTSEVRPRSVPLAARLSPHSGDRPLQGHTVGLLDIAKPRGDVFLDRLAELLTDQGATVRRYSKPTFTKPAPVDLRHEIAVQCDAVIEALAD